MRLDDGMGYDGQQRSRRPGLLLTWPMVVVAVVAVAVIAMIAGTMASARTVTPADPGLTPSNGATAPADSDPADSDPAASDRAGSDPASSTPTPEGHDAEERAGASLEVWGTFEAFMAAWCSTDPAVRRTGFARTATADLAQGLAETIPENVITAARTKVEVVGAGPYSAEFRVWFEKVPTSVHAILIADPGSPHGWRVTRVEKRGD